MTTVIKTLEDLKVIVNAGGYNVPIIPKNLLKHAGYVVKENGNMRHLYGTNESSNAVLLDARMESCYHDGTPIYDEKKMVIIKEIFSQPIHFVYGKIDFLIQVLTNREFLSEFLSAPVDKDIQSKKYHSLFMSWYLSYIKNATAYYLGTMYSVNELKRITGVIGIIYRSLHTKYPTMFDLEVPITKPNKKLFISPIDICIYACTTNGTEDKTPHEWILKKLLNIDKQLNPYLLCSNKTFILKDSFNSLETAFKEFSKHPTRTVILLKSGQWDVPECGDIVNTTGFKYIDNFKHLSDCISNLI
jgi:hypothetical protein